MWRGNERSWKLYRADLEVGAYKSPADVFADDAARAAYWDCRRRAESAAAAHRAFAATPFAVAAEVARVEAAYAAAAAQRHNAAARESVAQAAGIAAALRGEADPTAYRARQLGMTRREHDEACARWDARAAAASVPVPVPGPFAGLAALMRRD